MVETNRIELEAVFEAGVFRPLTPPALTSGAHVHLTVEATLHLLDPVELAGRVYDGLSEAQIEDLESVILDRSNFSASRSLG